MIVVCNHNSYFVQKKDVFGAIGLIPQQKIIAPLRMLTYEVSADQVDEITRMGKSTILESLLRFCRAIESIYIVECLRKPTNIDLQRLLKKAEMRGFPGMIGSIDLFNDVLQGNAPKITYCVNRHMYNGPYYLAYDIYPRWSTFIKTVTRPRSAKEKHFASCQEGCRKDVERCFGILQAHWAIVRGATRLFDAESLQSIMTTCIILHNMIVEEEYDHDVVDEYELDTMNNSRTRIYCAHDGTEESV
ncbi:uncharacterized protein [Pyrus communis]|uniref:uncharacterized protein n=1 Tax=Pyrus communis TaxID=23211 RepID=UPI0035BF7713